MVCPCAFTYDPVTTALPDVVVEPDNEVTDDDARARLQSYPFSRRGERNY